MLDTVNSKRKIMVKNIYIRVSKIRQAALMFRIILFLLVLFPQVIQAQITIVSSDMPVSGDTIRYSNASIINLPDLSKTGTNYQWDFSTLDMQSQDVYSYLASGKTPYILNFGFTAIGLKIADTLGTDQFRLQNVYNFFRISSNRYEGVGTGFTFGSFPLPQSGKHSDPDEVYRFPLTYGHTADETFSVTIPVMLSIVPVGNVFMTGKRHNEVDGWGTISTPYIQNEPCIRIVSVIEETDSVAITTPPLNLAIPVKRIEYKWLSKDEKIPLLEISGTEAAGRFIPRYIRYRDNYRSIGMNGPNADFTSLKTDIFENDTVYFQSTSTGAINVHQWTIQPANNIRYANGTNANSQNPAVIFEKEGVYDVKLNVIGTQGVDSMFKQGYIKVSALGMNPLIQETAKFWPNPAATILNVRDDLDEVQLFDIHGQILELDRIHSHQFDIRGLSPGVYWIQFQTKQGITHKDKILKTY